MKKKDMSPKPPIALLTAMNNWWRAKLVHDTAYSEYEDYSWDYYGADFIKDLQQASSEVAEELDTYVRGIVTEIIQTEKEKRQHLLEKLKCLQTHSKKENKS